MSDATAVAGRWSARDTTAGEVLAAITRLRREEARNAVRTAVLSLVVVARHAGECAALADVLHTLGRRHPSHAVIVVAGAPDAAPRLDADVRVHTESHDGRAFSFEDVTLHVDGPAVAHLDSLVEPFTLPDLPVAVWLPGRLPELGDPLLAAADRVVVDTKEVGDVAAFPDLVALGRRFPVTDLSWVRLAPWRELTAGLFEGDAFRPFLDGVRAVRVAGKEGPRHLMAGWLASRLDLDPAVVALRDHRHVTIEIDAVHGGHAGRFAVSRPTSERIVEASVEIEDGPCHARTLRLRDRSPSRVLGHALAQLGHDRVYEQAVAGAAELAGGAAPTP